MQEVYFDNAATTKISDNAFGKMLPFLREGYGNPSSTIYALGRNGFTAVDNARGEVASALNCNKSEVFFTAGGSESNNWAIKEVVKSSIQNSQGKNDENAKPHIITTVFEHHAVLHVCSRLEKEMCVDVTYLPVYDDGIIKLRDLEKAFRPETVLVTIMTANNEIGTIQPIKEIGDICRKHSVIFHTDAVQAVGHIPIDVEEMNIDLLSLSGHKFHGAKGVGALYIRKGIKLPSLIDGGAQERNKRAGTENVPGIVSLGAAIKEAVEGMESHNALMLEKRERIYNAIITSGDYKKVRLNGHKEKRLSNNLNFSFEGIEGEALLLKLSLVGIAASSGSACTSGSLDPSHVLLALGLPHEIAHGSLRITLSRYTTDDEVSYFLEQLPPIVGELRKLSPVWEDEI